MRRVFINRFFPPLLLERLLLEIRSFFQNVCESLTDAWLRLKNMLQKCHGHGLTKGAIIQIFYHCLDETTEGILDETAGGIFLYKSLNQAFQFLDDKVLFQLDWSAKSRNEHRQKSVAFADRGNSNNDNSRLMIKLEALTIKMDSQFTSLKEELQNMRNIYYDLKENHASKNHMNDDTPMCERHEANYIELEEQTNRTEPPPPPQAQTEHVNVVFTGSGKFDDPPKIQKDPPPSIIVNNKIEKDRPFKTTKGDYHMIKSKEYFLAIVLQKANQIQDFGPTSGIRASRGTLMMMNHHNMKMHQTVKEEYDIWAMEMEHYLEYIDNDVWKRFGNCHGAEVSTKGWKKKMQKAVLKQQFEAFSISSSEGLEKGYDRF
ncbi:hypothetical protein Tco_0854586 [Tanacetum coccineum]